MVAAVAVAAACSFAWAQPDEAGVGPAAAGVGAPPAVRGTREDLARSYLRLERALRTARLSAEALRRVNRAFDRASMRLYGDGYLRALELINAAWIDALDAGRIAGRDRAATPSDTALAAAAAVRAVVDPTVALLNGDAAPPLVVRLRTLYDWSATSVGTAPPPTAHPTAPKAGVACELTIERPGGGAALLARTVRIFADRVEPAAISLAEPLDGVKPGAASISLRFADGPTVEIGVMRFAARDPDDVREATLERLSQLDAQAQNDARDGGEDPLALARAILRARAGLLTDTPSPNRSAQFLQDPATLVQAVQDELAAIERGEDPYKGRVGDRWQVILARGAAYPARVFAPEQAATGDPLPLVIAFHGAGGDENLFMDGYAAGRLKELASERGFLLVTPRTSPLASSPVFLDGLLKTIQAQYSVDRNRVYVMGHSLGAGVTAGLARLAHDKIAACVCLAGGGAFETNGGSAPTLVYAAELDPIIPAWRIIEGAQRAEADGLPVQHRLVRGRGHTLFIGAVLDEAVDWLFMHTLDEQAQRDATKASSP